MKESFYKTVEKNEKFPIPLEFLENKTEVRFKAVSANQNNNFSGEYNYYSLENLIKDKRNVNDFEIDDEDINSDILGETIVIEKNQRLIFK